MNKKKNNENINKNIIIFILFIIIILCIIVIIQLIYLIPKKKRANELKDENFEYFFDDKEKHLELNNGYKIIN
jgi:NADH:ubiquinone oxidoreductase subunit 3 (subunit A)